MDFVCNAKQLGNSLWSFAIYLFRQQIYYLVLCAVNMNLPTEMRNFMSSNES